MRCRRLIYAILVSLFCVAMVRAQGITSRVTGTVADPSGAVVPEATVTLSNEATGVSFSTATTSAGTYVFEAMQVGTYKLTVEKSGFKKSVSSSNVLTIGQPMTVNVRLQVGEVAQTVEVRGAAEMVQTSTSGNFGNIVDQRAIQQLPIVGVRGRNPIDFVLFQPGVVSGSNTGGGVHVNGSRDRAWNFTLDGIDINETSAGGSNFSPLRTNPDSISEFRVITSNFTSEYGRNSGGMVTMVTRSGTNEFHGEGFEFYQTPRLQANSFGNNINGLAKPQLVQHIFGFSLGGPIRKDKTFFFTNLQRLRTHETRGVTSLVFTQDARNGIFRYVKGGRNLPAGTTGASVDASGNALPGVNIGTFNVVANDPAGLGLDPTVQKVIGLTPLPNNFTAGDGLNTAGFSFSSIQTEKQVDFLIRGDHTFNERNTVFVRWANGHQNTVGDFTNGGASPFPGAPRVVDTRRTPRNLAVSWRWIPTSRTTNELVLGMNRFTFDFANPDPNFQSNPPFTLGIVTDPLQNFVGNLRALTTPQLADNFTYIRGSHTFKTGINFRWGRHIDRRGSVGAFNVQPLANFSTSVNTVDSEAFKLPTDINTKNDLPTLKSTINDLLGRVGDVTQSFVSLPSGDQFAPPGTVYSFDARYPEYDFYGQDTWKVRRNLTVDLGLRWEVNLTPCNRAGRISHPDQPFVVGATPSNTLNWVKGPLFHTTRGDFAPSVGVAWDPFGTGKTSVRANYRLAYDRINTFVLSSAVFQSLPGQTFSVDNQSFGQAGGRLQGGLPVLSPPSGVTPNQLAQPPPFSTSAITVVDPNWRPPKVNQWGLSIQRQLAPSTVLEVSYVGNHGVGLFGGYDANQVNIFGNGFLDAFKIVAAGGDSPLMNALLQADPSRKAGETGSQEVRRLFPSTLSLGSVGALAATLGSRTVKGVPVIVASGFSPFFFFQNPQFAGGFNVLDSNDNSTYHSLQAQVQRRTSRNLTFQLSYTFAKSLDTRSFDPTFSRVSRGALQSASSTPLDLRNRRLNYARSDFDRRHALQGMWVWTLPFGSGQRWAGQLNSVLDRIVGGWETAGILTWESGRPFTAYSGAFTVSNVVQSPADCSGCSGDMGSLRLEPSAGTTFLFTPDQRSKFSTPAPGQLGNATRNFFTLPGFFDLDLNIAKRTRITERQSLEFRLEMTNATNHPSFGLPNSAIITSSILHGSGGPSFHRREESSWASNTTFDAGGGLTTASKSLNALRAARQLTGRPLPFTRVAMPCVSVRVSYAFQSA